MHRGCRRLSADQRHPRLPGTGGTESIRTLPNFGADPDRHTDEEAQIPLLMAVQHNDPALVRLLLSAGADANVLPIKRSRACRTPEQY
ncbi:MAG: hypothetical protein R3E89_15745 [Thiolinea sp.]